MGILHLVVLCFIGVDHAQDGTVLGGSLTRASACVCVWHVRFLAAVS